MTTLLRPLVTGIIFLAALLLSAPLLRADTGTESEIIIPEFPVYPAPKEKLSEDDRGTLYFTSRTPTDFRWLFARDAPRYPMTVQGDLYLPDAASAETPVPAMIILHGSGDIRESREIAYAKLLQSRGVAAFVIHSFAARGLTQETPYLMRVLAMSHVDAMTDAYSALKFLNLHPAIRHDRVGLLGFSYGGMATRAAIDKRMYDTLAEDHEPFAVHIDFYGPCHTDLGTRRTTGAPYISVRGTEDASNNLDACATREREIEQGGSHVTAELIEGAGHAWEFGHERQFVQTLNVAPCELRLADNGLWTLGDIILETRPEADRPERIRDRLEMVEAMKQNCMSTGYIMGHDPRSTEIARELLLQYVEMHLKNGYTAPN